MNTTKNRPDATTSSTTIKKIGEYSFEGCTMSKLGIFEDNTLKVQITPKGLMECLTNQCIDLTLKGKSPYAYSNMYLEGERYGVSVSLHYDHNIRQILCAVFVHSDNGTPAELQYKWAVFANSHFLKSGILNNKTFVKKIKRSLTLVESAYYTTMRLYKETV